MRVIGLEPTHLAIPDPKSGASTNFATRAYGVQSYRLFLIRQISWAEIKWAALLFKGSWREGLEKIEGGGIFSVFQGQAVEVFS